MLSTRLLQSITLEDSNLNQLKRRSHLNRLDSDPQNVARDEHANRQSSSYRVDAPVVPVYNTKLKFAENAPVRQSLTSPGVPQDRMRLDTELKRSAQVKPETLREMPMFAGTLENYAYRNLPSGENGVPIEPEGLVFPYGRSQRRPILIDDTFDRKFANSMVAAREQRRLDSFAHFPVSRDTRLATTIQAKR